MSKSNFLTLYFIIFIAVFTSCQVTNVGNQRSSKSNKPPKKVSSKAIDNGVASWYGPGFHGKKTANGEKFNTNAFTAAHRTLPFGTVVLVKNIENGKEVRVRINDRGPFAKNRIIDLSKAAASKINMITAGTAKVSLFLISTPNDELTIDNIKEAGYTVQIAAYKDVKLATQKSIEFDEGWVKSVIVNKNRVHRVYYGKYKSVAQANVALDKLKHKGVNGFVKQIEN